MRLAVKKEPIESPCQREGLTDASRSVETPCSFDPNPLISLILDPEMIADLPDSIEIFPKEVKQSDNPLNLDLRIDNLTYSLITPCNKVLTCDYTPRR
jgi:hypothetical protein